MKGDRRRKTTRDQELRRLAAKIRDMDHLDGLVSQVPEKMQDAVRGLMLEHVKFCPHGHAHQTPREAATTTKEFSHC